jgi:hypothetical protein
MPRPTGQRSRLSRRIVWGVAVDGAVWRGHVVAPVPTREPVRGLMNERPVVCAVHVGGRRDLRLLRELVDTWLHRYRDTRRCAGVGPCD